MGVSVAVPVYNEIKYIHRTLQSLLKNYEDIDEILISDNASTDGTSEICRDYSEKYVKIKYFRFDRNMGIFENWYSALERSTQPYFMWLGGHDVVPEGYIHKMRNSLESTNAVLAYCRSDFYDPEFKEVLSVIDYSRDFIQINKKGVDIFDRIRFMLEEVRPEMMVHGLYNKEALMKTYRGAGKFRGDDEGTIILLAFEGHFAYCPDTSYLRMYNRGTDNFFITWKRYGKVLYENNTHWIKIYQDFFRMQLRSIEPMKTISKGKYLKLRQIIYERYWLPPIALEKYNTNNEILYRFIDVIKRLIYRKFAKKRQLLEMDQKYSPAPFKFEFISYIGSRIVPRSLLRNFKNKYFKP